MIDRLNLCAGVERAIRFQFFLDDRDQHIGGDGASALTPHGGLAGCEKSLDAEVLLDTFEKQFDLPAAFIERSDGHRRQCGVVCQKYRILLVSGSWKQMQRR